MIVVGAKPVFEAGTVQALYDQAVIASYCYCDFDRVGVIQVKDTAIV